ncbi:L-aminoadipate-semialdehyde dehydrogenase-phosphopantetheinyl transferase-like [Micractinium conductrix]|uniref:holo-[acyl-carrier-protein] synthase n=1 Tax=Micractinium conductrix TaxID=554055 RepID=A0A2P6VGF3_9CHLO|nr:L-aminoadipate-semialdehyde dehydrogenase-phosphopantetheinyl transferase-like [Micractinium conductrix]|eukprot:PSC73182.1 L-aminoadipate-semialdehyde dehydrogenase-phosphopantetheinyl transferase-like [Micractinium conductrix]
MAAPGRLRWAVCLRGWEPAASELDLLLSWLPAEERTQCERFRQPADKQRALVSRLLARRAAAVALGLPQGDAVVKRTRGGKPYVANELPGKAEGPVPNWNYSVSHEGDYVILAAEPVAVCGCDVAAPRAARRAAGGRAESLEDFFASFERQFTAAEWDMIRGAGVEAEQESAFRKLWSLKEAFVKAMGLGLGYELGDVEFALNGGSTATASVQGSPHREWAFHLHQLGGGHWAAVARAPLAEVVDAWGGFTATFKKTEFGPGEWQEQLAAPEPAFSMLGVADLVPPEQRSAYAAAGGELV